MPAPLIRRTVIGPYHVKRVLGEGGMGTVYLARTEHGEEVAVKVLRQAEDLNGDAALERFKREARISLELSHANIVRTLRAGAVDGCIYIASEYMRGGSLADILERKGHVSVPVALRIARDVLSALQAIEQAGLVHRDVKPGNVLLALDGTCKLADLGLARPVSVRRTRYTTTGVLIGSPHYMSPEQIDNITDLDNRSDMYALGVVLYECLAGQRPFEGRTPFQVLKLHMTAPPTPLRVVAPQVPEPVAALVEQMLAKPREQRPTVTSALKTVTHFIERPLDLTLSASVDSDSDDPNASTEAPIPLELLVAEVAADRPRTGDGADVVAIEALRKACLRWTTPEGEKRLHVFAGSRMVFGREGAEPGTIDAMLRVKKGAVETQRISRRHFEIFFHGMVPQIRDLGARGGTRVDEVLLHPNEPRALPPRAVIGVSSVLRMTARTIWPRLDGSTSGAGRAFAPALVIEATSEGAEDIYALVPNSLSLGSRPGVGLVWGAPGDTDILDFDGYLWVRGGGLARGASTPAVPNLTFTVEQTNVVVTPPVAP